MPGMPRMGRVIADSRLTMFDTKSTRQTQPCAGCGGDIDCKANKRFCQPCSDDQIRKQRASYKARKRAAAHA